MAYSSKLHAFCKFNLSEGCCLWQCLGFVDDTLRDIVHPVENQRVTYNEHKQKHGLKYQPLTTPNSIIANLFGVVEVRRHVSSMLVMSGMMPVLENFSVRPNRERVCVYIYGDPAYLLRWYLYRPLRVSQITPDQNEFNKNMSKVRISVEWNVVENFKFSDY